MDKEVLVRVPPGDRWAWVGQPKKVIANNLTDALAEVARKHNVKVFTMDARSGSVTIDDGEEKPIYEHSLYEE